jgi:hypothetical protein
MKKLFFYLIPIIFFFSCARENYTYDHIFKNDTNYDVVVTNRDGSPDFSFNVPANSTQTFYTNSLYGLFYITSSQTDLNFNYELTNGVHDIFSFENMVLYKVYGTAENVDITYNNSEGNTIQSTVDLPYEIGYDYFKNSFKYISAQNNGELGTVTVEYYYYDDLIDSDACQGSYCVVTASN